MTIYALGDLEPKIHETAFVHPQATIIGDVTIGAYSSVWPGAVLRADFAPIIVGERTSIQDGSIVHVGQNKPTVIGDDVVIGHLVHLEACTIGSRVLIGVGSLVRHGCTIEDESIVGAHAMLRDGTRVPSGHRALGLPAQVKPGHVDLVDIKRITDMYVENTKLYSKSLRELEH